MFFNQAILIGNLAQDAEFFINHKTNDPGCKFLVVTAEDNKTSLGSKKVLIKVSLWGNRVKTLQHVLKKGARVFVKGHLFAYTRQRGTDLPHTETEVVASLVVSLDVKPGKPLAEYTNGLQEPSEEV